MVLPEYIARTVVLLRFQRLSAEGTYKWICMRLKDKNYYTNQTKYRTYERYLVGLKQGHCKAKSINRIRAVG